MSPNNTTDGMLQKGWIIENNKRILVKGTYQASREEPIDVNTLEWVRTTPIFDNGESMQCEKLTNNINFSNGEEKFFSNTNKNYEEILKSIGHNISRIDITKLDGLVEEYREKLEKYKIYTDSSEERIDKLCEGLQFRMNMLNKKINGSIF